jgi:hypothetical protein
MWPASRESWALHDTVRTALEPRNPSGPSTLSNRMSRSDRGAYFIADVVVHPRYASLSGERIAGHWLLSKAGSAPRRFRVFSG